MAPFATTSLPTPTKKTFIHDYIALCTSVVDSGQIGTWLLTHARLMSQDMFVEADNDWTLLEPYQILALRAVTPDNDANLWNSWSKDQYLSRVSGDDERMALADGMFQTDDAKWVKTVPEDIRPQIIILTQLAYRRNIRWGNQEVKRM